MPQLWTTRCITAETTRVSVTRVLEDPHQHPRSSPTSANASSHTRARQTHEILVSTSLRQPQRNYTDGSFHLVPPPLLPERPPKLTSVRSTSGVTARYALLVPIKAYSGDLSSTVPCASLVRAFCPREAGINSPCVLRHSHSVHKPSSSTSTDELKQFLSAVCRAAHACHVVGGPTGTNPENARGVTRLESKGVRLPSETSSDSKSSRGGMPSRTCCISPTSPGKR